MEPVDSGFKLVLLEFDIVPEEESREAGLFHLLLLFSVERKLSPFRSNCGINHLNYDTSKEALWIIYRKKYRTSSNNQSTSKQTNSEQETAEAEADAGRRECAIRKRVRVAKKNWAHTHTPTLVKCRARNNK